MSCAKDAHTTDHAYPRVGFAHSFHSALPNSLTVTGASNRTITGSIIPLDGGLHISTGPELFNEAKKIK